jgi:hypothetical protein
LKRADGPARHAETLQRFASKRQRSQLAWRSPAASRDRALTAASRILLWSRRRTRSSSEITKHRGWRPRERLSPPTVCSRRSRAQGVLAQQPLCGVAGWGGDPDQEAEPQVPRPNEITVRRSRSLSTSRAFPARRGLCGSLRWCWPRLAPCRCGGTDSDRAPASGGPPVRCSQELHQRGHE